MNPVQSWLSVFSPDNKENIPYTVEIEQRAMDLLQRDEFDDDCREFAEAYSEVLDFPMMWVAVNAPVESRWDAYRAIVNA